MSSTTVTKKPKKVITTVRIDPSIKAWAQSYAAAHGADLSTLINMQLFHIRQRESARENPHMSDMQYERYMRMLEEIDSGKVITEQFATVSDMKKSYSL
jgi:antitoxin component of RelBE/YafQ-DinJ toxin-antitoxin module